VREREVMELLADGLSGAEIASQLVLSPETVRTHIRNAMSKLGASTRSQAVAIALGNREIAGGADPAAEAEPASASRRAERPPAAAVHAGALDDAISELLHQLVSLWDVDAGSVFLADEDGMTMRRAAHVPNGGIDEAPPRVALGEGTYGRVALERRAQVVGGAGANALIVAPMLAGGRLVGVLGLSMRPSRPVGRQEQLLLQAFAARVGEVVSAGGDSTQARLQQAFERFRFSWAAAGHGA
jgi:DNA-binding CsgD family transcriptional regulator